MGASSVLCKCVSKDVFRRLEYPIALSVILVELDKNIARSFVPDARRVGFRCDATVGNGPERLVFH